MDRIGHAGTLVLQIALFHAGTGDRLHAHQQIAEQAQRVAVHKGMLLPCHGQPLDILIGNSPGGSIQIPNHKGQPSQELLPVRGGEIIASVADLGEERTVANQERIPGRCEQLKPLHRAILNQHHQIHREHTIAIGNPVIAALDPGGLALVILAGNIDTVNLLVRLSQDHAAIAEGQLHLAVIIAVIVVQPTAIGHLHAAGILHQAHRCIVQQTDALNHLLQHRQLPGGGQIAAGQLKLGLAVRFVHKNLPLQLLIPQVGALFIEQPGGQAPVGPGYFHLKAGQDLIGPQILQVLFQVDGGIRPLGDRHAGGAQHLHLLHQKLAGDDISQVAIHTAAIGQAAGEIVQVLPTYIGATLIEIGIQIPRIDAEPVISGLSRGEGNLLIAIAQQHHIRSNARCQLQHRGGFIDANLGTVNQATGGGGGDGHIARGIKLQHRIGFAGIGDVRNLRVAGNPNQGLNLAGLRIPDYIHIQAVAHISGGGFGNQGNPLGRATGIQQENMVNALGVIAPEFHIDGIGLPCLRLETEDIAAVQIDPIHRGGHLHTAPHIHALIKADCQGVGAADRRREGKGLLRFAVQPTGTRDGNGTALAHLQGVGVCDGHIEVGRHRTGGGGGNGGGTGTQKLILDTIAVTGDADHRFIGGGPGNGIGRAIRQANQRGAASLANVTGGQRNALQPQLLHRSRRGKQEGASRHPLRRRDTDNRQPVGYTGLGLEANAAQTRRQALGGIVRVLGSHGMDAQPAVGTAIHIIKHIQPLRLRRKAVMHNRVIGADLEGNALIGENQRVQRGPGIGGAAKPHRQAKRQDNGKEFFHRPDTSPLKRFFNIL